MQTVFVCRKITPMQLNNEKDVDIMRIYYQAKSVDENKIT